MSVRRAAPKQCRLRPGRPCPRLPTTELIRLPDSWNPGVRFAELSHVGMRRANNQDALAVMIAESEDRLQRRGHLFVVADGMGAHAAGELASKIASEQIAMQYYRSRENSPQMAIVEAVQVANGAIFQRGHSNPEFHNMGTTASTLVLVGGQALVAHVGDSRVYRLRGETFEQLTFDHSLVWEMHASGQIPSDSPLGKSIPKNVITRSLGPAQEVTVDLEGPFDVRPDDRFLICSDGLTGQIEDDELGVLLRCVDLDKAASVLVDLANLRGGPDNTTVILVQIQGDRLTRRSVSGVQVRPARKPWYDASNLLLATVGLCWVGAISFGLAAALGHQRLIGSAVIALVLGAIAAGVWLGNRRREQTAGKQKTDAAGNTGGQDPVEPYVQGTGPYRRCSASPSRAAYDRLHHLIEDLRQSAERNDWGMNWSAVDDLLDRARTAVDQNDLRSAIGLQAEAVLESMRQLRKYQDDSASDTAVDL